MTAFNDRRQENICCYKNLEWQLMIDWEFEMLANQPKIFGRKHLF
jgi:hypothetical protein